MAQIKHYKHGLLFVLLSVLLVSVAQLLLKYGMMQLPGQRDISSYRLVFDNEYLFASLLPIAAGLICYVFSVFSWLSALVHFPLSVAYPLLSLSYLLVYLAAVFLPMFNESASIVRFVGIGLLIAGVALVAWPSDSDRA